MGLVIHVSSSEENRLKVLITHHSIGVDKDNIDDFERVVNERYQSLTHFRDNVETIKIKYNGRIIDLVVFENFAVALGGSSYTRGELEAIRKLLTGSGRVTDIYAESRKAK